MIEELPDDIDNDELDDVEPVGDEAQLYEHFRVVVDKGQEMMRTNCFFKPVKQVICHERKHHPPP